MAQPADPDVVDFANAGHGGGEGLYAVYDGGVDGVDEALAHAEDGVFEDEEDDDGDEEAGDGVGQGEAEGDADDACQHREGGETVGAGVLAVGYESRAAYLAAGADAQLGHGLVADEADDRSGGDPREVGERRRVEELCDRLIEGQ